MTTKELFLDQYKATYDEKNWYPNLLEAVDGLTDEQANWKPADNLNSILQLVHHLVFWNERYLRRFRGEIPPPVEKSDKDPSFDIGEPDWNRTLEIFKRVMSELQDELSKADEQKLQSKPFKEYDDPWYSVFSNIHIHNAYHTGQIIMLRKMQNCF